MSRVFVSGIMAIRCDRVTLDKAETLSNGFLRADAYLTRAGVFEYHAPDGSVTRELRSVDEVFHPDSIASLAMVPLTDDHPSALVDLSNVDQVSIGHVGDTVQRVDRFVRARVMVTHAGAIDDVKLGRKRELSCGYTCDLEPESGEYDGQRYDAVQKNIRYNHVALVNRGRAGPEVRVRLDAAIADMPTAAERETMMLAIGGQEIELPDDAAQLIEAEMAKLKNEIAILMAKLETMKSAEEMDAAKAKSDALEAEVAALKSERSDALSADRVSAAVQARLALERSAAKIVGAEKLDGMTDREIMVSVVKHSAPDAKLDDESDVYVGARFDHVVETASERNDSLADANRVARLSVSDKSDSAKARTEMIRKLHALASAPLAATKEA